MQTVSSENRNRRRVRIVSLMIALLAFSVLPLTQAVPATTWDRIRSAGKIVLGYRADAQPFSYKDNSGAPIGYSVTLCQQIADQVKGELALPKLTVEWVPVTLADSFTAVAQGKIDLMCGATSVTLARRKEVAFSIPIFPSGIGALLRADAPVALREALSRSQSPSHPVWRGSPARTVLEKKTFAVVAGTSAETWLSERLNEFQLDASIKTVANYEAGIQAVIVGDAAVFFGDRPILLVTALRGGSAENLIVLNRLFADEPVALVLARGDDDLRLVVDRTLSRLFRSNDFPGLYTKWFGSADSETIDFFRMNAQPD
jgi:polar amino acid transport system substrate-binding protein